VSAGSLSASEHAPTYGLDHLWAKHRNLLEG